jgi:hypothetical protein
VDGSDCRDRLDFDDDSTAHDNVGAVATVQLNAFLDSGNRFLLLVRKLAERQFVTHGLAIDELEKSRAELSMDGDCRANDDMCELDVVHWECENSEDRIYI